MLRDRRLRLLETAAAQVVGLGVVSVAAPADGVSARVVIEETLRGFGVLRDESAVRLPIAALAATQPPAVACHRRAGGGSADR